MQSLRELDLESAYHAHFEEPHGAEWRPTYFRRRAAGERFHLHYIFVPKKWAAECRVELGEPEPWLRLSDNMPVVVSAAPA